MVKKEITVETYPIKDTVCKFYTEVCKDKNHRFISWEHCYQHFKSNNIDIDMASLHLAFYLASWGMYRGSAGILWKDYKIHKEAVRIIIKPEYRMLGEVNLIKDVDKYKSSLMLLFDELSGYYKGIKYSNGKTIKRINATPTLVTKIILGTIGAFPALDRFFCDGFKDMHSEVVTKFAPRTIEAILMFTKNNMAQVNKVQDEVYKMNGHRVKYPPMKIVDMYFWQIGALNE